MNIEDRCFVTMYQPYIVSRARHFMPYTDREYTTMIDREDLVQEAALWFYRTMKEKGRDAAIKYRLSLHHELYDVIRKAYPLHVPYHAFGKHKCTFVALDDEAMQSGINAVYQKDVEETAIDNVFAERLFACLTDKERLIVNMRMSGGTLSDIAEVLEVTERTVRNYIYVMRDRLSEYFKNS